ncbi:hypothetical protein C8N40_10130 [Pontibacter mucosus]|uniref:Uncharacterized protein n=1 Tax=Pontibacter mucosus TaxID=1649266 RepID=A0A2T5YS90_9BACT|nr:hypothetical protein [Pontibacter mucosus]PTX22208.1 hypothetical protein C8N40_10130 [Pontibacter mucosus]
MKFPYILLLILLLLADVFAYTEVVTLIRQPSDASVVLGFGLLALLILANFLLIRFTLNKLKA